MDFKLSKYIIPSVISMVLVGTYTNIDGLFIGNVSGDAGLAAINIAWPIVAFITSLGTGIGIGGSVILSSLKGQGKQNDADEIKKNIIVLLTIAGIIIGILSLLIYKPLLKIMGASLDVFKYAKDYSFIISLGAVFQVLGAGLVVVLRNEGKTYQAMLYTVAGLVVHVLLDFLFVKKYELSGVAASTVISQAVIMLLCLFSAKTKRGLKIKPLCFKEILKASTAPFGLNFVPSAVLLFTNYFAMKSGGTAAVSAYAVMSYAVYTFDYVFQGVCDGVQPVISYCLGSKDLNGEKRSVTAAVKILAVFSVIFAVSTPLMIEFLPKIFAVSEGASKMMKSGLKIYALSYPLKAGVKMLCSYYYARNDAKISNFLTYIDPLLLTPILLIILPVWFGSNGIWLSLVFSQAAVCILGACFILSKKNK